MNVITWKRKGFITLHFGGKMVYRFNFLVNKRSYHPFFPSTPL